MAADHLRESASRICGNQRVHGSVLSVVERGWAGARQCSLALAGRDIQVHHLIKGWLGRELRAMIVPYPHIRVRSVPRPLFRAGLWWALVTQPAVGRLRWLLIDHERTWGEVQWWCRMFRVTPLFIRDFDDRFELSSDGRIVPLADAFPCD